MINNNFLETIDSFITEEECLDIINLVKDEFEITTVLGEQIIDYRVAKGAWVDDYLANNNPLINKIKKFVSDKTSLPIENQEQIHVVKYNVKGEYKDHHDFFHPSEEYYENEMQRGGQRIFTCLIYLNNNFTGGETFFPKKNIKIKPKIGKMIIWKNINKTQYGTYYFDDSTIHTGLPVLTGIKYIAIIWVRENKFT
jgi:prolyl 4-hydroxylase